MKILHPLLGYFTIIEDIGHGTFCNVYMAQHDETKLHVAIKILDSPIQSDVDNEMNIMKMLNHPYIVSVYDRFEYDGNICYLSELIGGETLLCYINSRGSIPEKKSKVIFAQMFSLIKYIHQNKKIVHRDLKCENLMVDASGNIHLIDFGFSKVFANTNESSKSDSNISFVEKNDHNNTGIASTDDNCKLRLVNNRSNSAILKTVCGSPGYTAPEIISNEIYGPSVDIWSLGVILFAITHGRLPFDDVNELTVLKRILICQPQYSQTASPELIDLLSKMLYKNSSKRISLEEIENHPWLTIDEKGFPYRINDSVYESSSTGINYETIDVIDKEMLNRAPYFSLSDLSNIKKSLKLKEKTKQTLLYQILRKQVLISELAPKISLILEPLSYQNRLSCIKCASADIGKQICQNELKTTFASILPPLNASETEKLSSPKILKPLNINITTHATDAIVKKRRQTAGMISTANFANVVKTRQIQFRRLSIIPASTS